MAVAATPADAQNLLTNPGAETGTFTGWTTGGTPAGQPMIDPWTHLAAPVNHTGDHRFGISVGWNTADAYQYQSVAVVPGTQYRVSLWVVKEDGTDEMLTVAWINGAFGGDEQWLYRIGGSTRYPQWTQLNGETFVPATSPITFVIRYEHLHATNIASIHVDDIELVAVGVVNTPTPTRTPGTPSPSFTPTRTPTETPATTDLDGDGLPDALEGWPPVGGQTHRLLFDSDGDGLSDSVEDANASGGWEAGETSARLRDSDGDGASDGTELQLLATDPLDPEVPASWTDADGDGLPAGLDLKDGNPDADGDGFMDGYEADTLGLNAAYDGNLWPPLGDLNLDAAISNIDALLAQSLFLQTVDPSARVFGGEGFRNADPDLNGFISNVDALLLQARFLGQLAYLPRNPATPTPLVTNTPRPTATPTRTATPGTPPPAELQNGTFEAAFVAGVGQGWTDFRARPGGFFKPNERLGRLGGGIYGCFGPDTTGTYSCMDEYESLRMSAKSYLISADRYDLIGTFRDVLGPEVILIAKNDPESLDIFPDGDTWEHNAYADGRRFADYYATEWIARYGGLAADAYYGLNEPSVNVVDHLRKVCAFELGFTERLHEMGLKSCVLNNSVGTPSPLENMLIPEVRDLLAVADYVGYHAYGQWGTGWMCPSSANPYTFRWQTVAQWYRERGWRHPPVIYTEAGQYWWYPEESPAAIRDDLVCYEQRERTEEWWSLGINYFVTGAWPGAWDAMHIGRFPEIIDGCRAANRAHPLDAHGGLNAQEFGGRNEAFDLGIRQRIQTQPGRTYDFSGWFKYEYEEGWPNRATIRVGWDPTGQDTDPDAPSVQWSADLIQLGPNNPIFAGPWDTDLWYRYTAALQATGTTATVWVRGAQDDDSQSARVYVDDLTLVGR